jgi:ATP-dependent DNA helicase PIF1
MCLTGPAGTGKSHILKHVMQHCITQDTNFAITAMTGAAASLIGGQTLHKWTGLGLIDKSVESSVAIINKNATTAQRWNETKVLVIDEISMMWADLFERLNKIAQRARNSTAFFGGIQIIFCGDFAQLPPINQPAYAFESQVWQDNLSSSTFYLSKIMRQDSPAFAELLSEVRMGKVTANTQRLLKSRIVQSADEAVCAIDIGDRLVTIKPTVLYPFRKEVDRVNAQELDTLKRSGSAVRVFTATDSKYDYKRRITTSASADDASVIEERCAKTIELAVGSLVMLTVNMDTERGLVNGSRGQIMEFRDGYPMVQFTNGEYEHVKPSSFESVVGSGIVRRMQVPLMLAWAITIHKCQGATLDGVVTDLRGAFCDAQSYVTLSRVRSIDNLFLLGIDFSRIRCSDRVKEYYTNLERGIVYGKTRIFAVEEEPELSECLL